MKIIIVTFLLAITLIGSSQNKICENISINSFELDAKQENTLAINVAIEDEDSFMPISYPGFLLRNEKGETVAQSTKEFATYTLANNTVYKLDTSLQIEATVQRRLHRKVNKEYDDNFVWRN